MGDDWREEYPREFIAMHEAAHAVVGLVLGCEVEQVEIQDRACFDYPDSVGSARIDLTGHNSVFAMAVCLAGTIAEATVNSDVYDQAVWRVDLEYVVRHSINAQRRGLGTPEVAIPAAMILCRGLVAHHLAAIRRVAVSLLEKGELTGDEVRVIVRGEDEGREELPFQ